MDINDLEKILKMLKISDVTDFELEQDGTNLKVRRGTVVKRGRVMDHLAGQGMPQMMDGSDPAASALQTAAPKAEDDSRYVKVQSPIVGTFYRKPSPDSEAFVKEGDRVKKGDTLCIVEAMKLMNEIEAPCGGVIEKILLNDAQVVEFGETLFLITPN